jgi:hypothetical protein
MHGNYKYIDKRSYSVEEAQSHIVVYLDRKGMKIPIFRESKNDRQIQWLQKGQTNGVSSTVFLDIAAFISNLYTSLHEEENPRLYSVSMRNCEPK